jgi:hypothetical protein
MHAPIAVAQARRANLLDPGFEAGLIGATGFVVVSGGDLESVAAVIPIPAGCRVWIATGCTDMRRGMQGLALQVPEQLKRDPHICVGRGASAWSRSR